MNFVAFRRNIALFLVAVIVIVLACRIVVALIEVILLAICLAIITFFGFAEDIKAAWNLIGSGMQEATAQWQNLIQKKKTKAPNAENQDADYQDVEHQDIKTEEHTQKAEEKEV